MNNAARLTKRDRKGHAYFDDDGAMIRGANGTFHQKKDMTGQFIHQRFVALDKAIDRLAAYEDTGMAPEEIQSLIQLPSDSITHCRECAMFKEHPTAPGYYICCPCPLNDEYAPLVKPDDFCKWGKPKEITHD